MKLGRIHFYQTKLETFRSFRLTTAALWFLTMTSTTFFQIKIVTLIATALFLFVFIPFVLATKALDNFIRELG